MDVHTDEPFQKVFNSSFVRIFLYALLCQLAMAITNTVLPLYVINGLHMSATQSGLLGMMFTLGSVASRFFAGGLCDRFGRRTMLVAGAVIEGAALLFLGFQTAFFMLLTFKAIQGVGHAFNSTASNAAASEVLPREKLGQGMGYFSLASTIVNAVGPTVCLVLMGVGTAAPAQKNYTLPLVVGGLGGLLAVAVGASMNYEARLPARMKKASRGVRLSDFLERRSMMPALLMLLQSFAIGAATYMIVFATDCGFETIGLYYILNALVMLAVRIFFGERLDAVRPKYVALIGVILNLLAYLLLGLTMREWAFLLSAVLTGIYQSMLVPTLNSLALKLAPRSRSGAASATYWLGFDTGMTIGLLAFGALIDRGGFRLAFLAAAGYMGAFGLVALAVLRRTKPVREIVSPEE